MKKSIGLLLVLMMVTCISAPAFAAKAAKSDIGYVNRQKVLASYPGVQDVVKNLEAQREAAQKEYDTRTKNLPEKDRVKINDEIASRIAEEEAKVMVPIAEKIEAAILKVAKAEGCEHVFDAGIVIYGGKDLTDLVIKELGSK